MNCKQAEEVLPLYAGGELEDKRATMVSEHVQTCAACARVADEYRESVHLTEQFAPPVFDESFYAGIRQHVLREIETEAMRPAWSQTIASFFRPRLTWAIAGMLLIAVSLFAFYSIVNRQDHEQQSAAQQPAKIDSGTKDASNSGPQGDEQAGRPSLVDRGGKEQQGAGVPQPRRKRSRDGSRQPSNVPEPVLFPPRDSAALDKTLRVEIQTNDPKIRIIWFVQQETGSVIPTSKGT